MTVHLNRRRVNVVVSLMRTDETNVDNAKLVLHGDNKPVIIASEVEDDTIVGHKTRVPIDRLDVRGSFPIRPLNIVIPSFDRTSRVWMFLPELA